MAIYFQSKGAKEYRFLSNFWWSPIRTADDVFPTAEHAYQATKTVNTGDYLRILTAPTPQLAKKLGAEVELRPDWEDDYHGRPLKVVVMKNVLRKKFGQHPDLAEKLLATGDEELVEWAPWGDRFWGVDKSYEGKNWLGKLLMECRADLRALGYIRLRHD